jgi:hypothetical protein
MVEQKVGCAPNLRHAVCTAGVPGALQPRRALDVIDLTEIEYMPIDRTPAGAPQLLGKRKSGQCPVWPIRCRCRPIARCPGKDV